jgi:CRISPR-associated protein Csa3
MGKKCIVIGASLNIAPARIALINSDVNDGDYAILVGISSDALKALVEFAKQIYQDFDVKVESITLNQGLNLIDTVSMLRSIIEGNAPCNVVIGIAGDRWVTTVLSFLAMALATVGGFVNVSVDRIFIMPGEKGEPVNWLIVPRLVDLSLVEYRVLKLICNGYGLAKEIVKGYASKYGETISLQAIERTLAKLRSKGLINSKPVGKALMHESTALGRLITCS